jgi:hypothetical protein
VVRAGHKRDANSNIDAEHLRQELRNWAGRRNIISATLKENTEPSNTEADDYIVVYEAEFVPASIWRTQLRLMLTGDGLIGVGLETRQRIADRLKIRNRRQGFADGFEPRPISIGEALFLLDAASRGEIAIAARIIPLYGLGRTKAIPMSKQKELCDLISKFYSAPSLDSGIWTRTVTFEPWL